MDSSALLATLRGEALADVCAKALIGERELVISAVTLAETIMVSRTRSVEPQLIKLLTALPFEIIPADADAPWRVGEIHRRWGKGNHPARLNIVDCFSYDVASQFGCPLLFIGNDFSQTDIVSVLPRSS